MSENTQYADSFQAMRLDELARDRSRVVVREDWFDDAANEACAKEQTERHARHAARLPGRLDAVMAQMETICPPRN